jgi:hypothetical protein
MNQPKKKQKKEKSVALPNPTTTSKNKNEEKLDKKVRDEVIKLGKVITDKTTIRFRNSN